MRAFIMGSVLLSALAANAESNQAIEHDEPPALGETARPLGEPAASDEPDEVTALPSDATAVPVGAEKEPLPAPATAAAAPAPASSGGAILGAAIGGAVGLAVAVVVGGAASYLGQALLFSLEASGPLLLAVPLASLVFPAALAGTGAWLGGAGVLGIVLAGVGAGILYPVGAIAGAVAGGALGLLAMSAGIGGGYLPALAGIGIGSTLGAVIGTCGGAALGAFAGEGSGATVE